MTKTEFFDFDTADHLNDPQTAANYLKGCMEEGGVALLQKGIGKVARAFGMSEVAANSGLTRASLYKALSESGSPALSTVDRVLASLGFRLSIEVANDEPRRTVPVPAVVVRDVKPQRVVVAGKQGVRIVRSPSSHTVVAANTTRRVSMATKGSKTTVVHRSAKSGEFVKASYAKKHPSTTVTERNKAPAKPKK